MINSRLKAIEKIFEIVEESNRVVSFKCRLCEETHKYEVMDDSLAVERWTSMNSTPVPFTTMLLDHILLHLVDLIKPDK